MRSGMIDVAVASVLLVIAVQCRETHWYWPVIASAMGILLGNLGWRLMV